MSERQIYLDNYWSLYNEFINEFKDIKYQDIPVALLYNFYQLLGPEVRDEMLKKDFTDKHLKYGVNESEIQPTFDKHIKEISGDRDLIISDGKILLSRLYLKFTENNYKKLDPEETLIFGFNVHYDELWDIPVERYSNYKLDASEDIELLLEEMTERFSNYHDHKVFSDEYFIERTLKTLPAIINTFASVENFLTINPNISVIVVGTTEDVLSRSLVLLGLKQGLPSICMQHGLITGEEAYLPIFATKMAIYGGLDRDLLLSKGARQEQLAITGHPRFDDVYESEHYTKETLCEEYDLDIDKKIIFIATQPFNPNLWDEFVEGILERHDVQILIKPHPIEIKRETLDSYLELEERFENVRVIKKNVAKFYNILNNIYIGLIKSSTAGIEMLMFNKVLCVMKVDDYDYYDNVGESVFEESRYLIEYVSKLLNSNLAYMAAQKSTHKFLDLAYPKKISMDEVIEVINEMRL